MRRRTYLGLAGASLLPIGVELSQSGLNADNFETRIPESIEGRPLQQVTEGDGEKYRIAIYESAYNALQIQYFPENDPRIVLMLQSAHFETDTLDEAVDVVGKFVRKVDVEYLTENDGIACRHEFSDGSYLTVGYAEWQKYEVDWNGRTINFDGPSERNNFVDNIVLNKIL
jgi:hypothetical protein